MTHPTASGRPWTRSAGNAKLIVLGHYLWPCRHALRVTSSGGPFFWSGAAQPAWQLSGPGTPSNVGSSPPTGRVRDRSRGSTCRQPNFTAIRRQRKKPRFLSDGPPQGVCRSPPTRRDSSTPKDAAAGPPGWRTPGTITLTAAPAAWSGERGGVERDNDRGTHPSEEAGRQLLPPVLSLPL